MYQQLSLYGTIRGNDIKINLHSLAAVSGMMPLSFFEHCIVCVPKYPYRPQLKAGEINQTEQYRINMVTNLQDTELNDKVPHSIATSRDKLTKLSWSLNISEVPEAAKLSHIARGQYSTTVVKGDPFVLINQLGYRPSSEYWIKGHEFIFGDLVVRIFRNLITDERYKQTFGALLATGSNSNTDTNTDRDNSKDVEMIEVDETEQKPYPSPSFKLVDHTGKWVVWAFVNVKNVTDLEGIAEATSQLEKFQSEMSGLFELGIPDKKSFDTRIKE